MAGAIALQSRTRRPPTTSFHGTDLSKSFDRAAPRALEMLILAVGSRLPLLRNDRFRDAAMTSVGL